MILCKKTEPAEPGHLACVRNGCQNEYTIHSVMRGNWCAPQLPSGIEPGSQLNEPWRKSWVSLWLSNTVIRRNWDCITTAESWREGLKYLSCLFLSVASVTTSGVVFHWTSICNLHALEFWHRFLDWMVHNLAFQWQMCWSAEKEKQLLFVSTTGTPSLQYLVFSAKQTPRLLKFLTRNCLSFYENNSELRTKTKCTPRNNNKFPITQTWGNYAKPIGTFCNWCDDQSPGIA